MLFKNSESKIQFSSLSRFVPKILSPNLTNSVKKQATKFSNDINKKRTQTKKIPNSQDVILRSKHDRNAGRISYNCGFIRWRNCWIFQSHGKI